MNLKPDAIVATWITGDSLHGYELHANGNLVERHRDSIGTVWSPPKVLASQRLSQTLPAFQDFLAGLTTEPGLDTSDPKWEGAQFPPINETEYEQLLDKRIQARLATDRAYLNAANAQQQAERERVIEDEECQRLDRQRGEARARRA